MYQEYYDNDNYQDDMNYSPVEEYNWSPNLFAKIVSYLNESVSPDVIRLGIIAGIRKSSSTEDAPTNWDKVETMRRYVSFGLFLHLCYRWGNRREKNHTG